MSKMWLVYWAGHNTLLRIAIMILAFSVIFARAGLPQTCPVCPTPNGACTASSLVSVLANFCLYPQTGCGGTNSTAFEVGGGPCCRPPGTPIIIDVDGSGFNLTSAEDGVDFDFFAIGAAVRMAWTAIGSTNAFLVRDLYGDGKIADGTEMFGNLTSQPPSSNKNGFAALAQYDSDGDGWIDDGDPVWPSLWLWIDTNHDGVSEPGELHTPASLGVERISVKYKEVDRVDANGNEFRYTARINDDGRRATYDVILTYVFLGAQGVPAAAVSKPATVDLERISAMDLLVLPQE